MNFPVITSPSLPPCIQAYGPAEASASSPGPWRARDGMELRAESTKSYRRTNTGLDNAGPGGPFGAIAFPSGPRPSNLDYACTGLGGLHVPIQSSDYAWARQPNEIQQIMGKRVGVFRLGLAACGSSKSFMKHDPFNMQAVQALFIMRDQRHHNRFHADGQTVSRTLWEQGPHRRHVGFPAGRPD